MCIDAGAPGITVHPRADARHITTADVHEIAGVARAAQRAASSSTSKAIRGPICSRSCSRCKPDQCTLVPVQPGEITSQAGWPADTPRDELARHRRATAARAASASACSSIPSRTPIRWARDDGRRSRRAVHRAVRARVRARRRRGARRASRVYAARRALAHELRPRRQRRPRPRPRQPRRCSARCRTSTRCRSATRSSAARCSSASSAPCANTSMPCDRSGAASSRDAVPCGAARWSLLAIVAAVARRRPPRHARHRSARPTASTLAGELYEPSPRPAPAVVLVHMLTRTKDDWDGRAPSDSQTPASRRWPSICAATAARADRAAICSAMDRRTCAPRSRGWRTRPDVRPAVDRHRRRVARREPRAAGGRRCAGGARARRCCRRRSTTAACGSTRPMQQYGGRPALLVASTHDPYALRIAARHSPTTPPGRASSASSTRAAHGTRAARRATPTSAGALVDWLRRRSLLS